SASSAEGIEQIFPQADMVKLVRSYRSTWEITDFAQRIYRNPELIAMERHGEPPEAIRFASEEEEQAFIKQLVADFQASGYRLMGILAKTEEQSKRLYALLESTGAHLLTADSTTFDAGVIITTTHLSKGLEFDQVLVPFVSDRNYRTEVDRSML